MDSWRDLAARIVAEESGVPAAPGVEPGLLALRGMRPPRRLCDARHWDEIKADAIRLQREGWADAATALGWHPLEIFGCGASSSADFEGLAVWIAGRRLLLLDAQSALVATPDGRASFDRRARARAMHAANPVFLWDLGR